MSARRARRFATIAMPMSTHPRRARIAAVSAASRSRRAVPRCRRSRRSPASARRIALAECRLPKLAHRRAVRHARGSGGPRRARRPQHGDLRRGAAGEHAVARSPIRWSCSPAARARRRRRSRRSRCALSGDPPHARHRADRPARHRPLVAARLRRVQAATSTREFEIDPVPKAPRAPGELAERGVDPAQYTTSAWSPTSRRSATRSATRRSTCGAAATARASRRNTCAAIPSTCAASCSTASRRRRCASRSTSGARATRRSTRVIAACAQSTPCSAGASRCRGDAGRVRARARHGGKDGRVADPRTGARAAAVT